jgi:small-conductance mechanosensitive channel
MNDWMASYEKFINQLGGANIYFTLALKVAVALVIAFIAWLILKMVLASFEKRTAPVEFFQNNARFFKVVRKALYYALLLATGTYIIRLSGIVLIERIYTAIFMVLFAVPATNLLLIVLRFAEKRLVNKDDTKLDDIVFDLLKRFSGAAIYALAIILALDTLGVNVMPFIAGAGIAGVAIGFAAKDTLSNIIAGILLIVDRPFEVGDRIEVWNTPAGTATWGDVIDIGLRATKIQTTDNIVIIIPNNEIMLRDIVNYTIITSRIRVRINIGIAYDANMKRAKEAILEVARSADWISVDPPPKVVVRNFGESSVDLQLRVWIEDARKRMETISYITDGVKEAFDRKEIEIPYPKRDIRIIYESKPEAP